VQAVTYALTMQRHFAATAKEDLGDEILTHRVGIHLGDVFVNDQDVMGDGVNIAARLQAAGGARWHLHLPDRLRRGENKLELDVVRLGHRELKNISQAIPMYRLLLGAAQPGASSGHATKVLPAPMPPPAFSLTRTQRVAAGLLLVLVLAVVAGLVMKSHEEREAALARSKATQEKIGAALTARWTTILAIKRPGKVAGTIRPGRREYNFAEMTRDQPADKTGSPRTTRWSGSRRTSACRRCCIGWTPRCPVYTKDSPLLVREPAGTVSSETKVFAGPTTGFILRKAAHPAAQLDGPEAGEPWVGHGQHAADSPVPPPREVVQGAQAFAFLYGLPEINASLRAGHLGGAN